MGKSDSPPPPDYTGAANATAAGNLAQQRIATTANRVNQYTPYGNSTYSQIGGQIQDPTAYQNALSDYQKSGGFLGGATPGGWGNSPTGADSGAGSTWTPATGGLWGAPVGPPPNRADFMMNNPDSQWRQDITLSPAGQQLLDRQNRTSSQLAGLQDAAVQRVGDAANSPLPGVYNPQEDTNNARDLILARMEPALNRDQEALRTQLVNQGFSPNSQAFTTSMDQFGRQKNDAYQQASLSGINLGQQQQAMRYAQALQNRGIPLNELNAIRTGSQVQNPNFSGVPQQGAVGGPNLTGAMQGTYNAALGNANAENAASANTQAGLFGLAASTSSQWGPALMSLFAASDRRLKRNIRKIGLSPKGLSIYNFNYIWSGNLEIGYMADEVEKVSPHAVFMHSSGYKMVDYNAV